MKTVLDALRFFGPMTPMQILHKVKMRKGFDDVTEFWVRGNLIKLKDAGKVRVSCISDELVFTWLGDL